MVGACVAGVLAINLGGLIYAWNSGRIIACFVVSGLLFIILGIQQTYCFLTSLENRIFPVHFVTNRLLVILFAQTAASTTIFFGMPCNYITLDVSSQSFSADLFRAALLSVCSQ